MIHRVPAFALRIGRFDDDVAGEIGDLAAIFAGAGMVILERLIERELRAVDGLIVPFFRECTSSRSSGSLRGA